jgi:hypothetical protein
MKFYLITVTGIFFIVDCSSQLKFTSEKSRHAFFKWKVQDQPEDLIFHQTIDLAIESLWIFKQDTSFGRIDTSDIQCQIRQTNGTTLSPDVCGEKTMVTNVKGDYLKFSNPIFFDDDKKVWIYMQYWSLGRLGVESIEIYERINDGYKKLLEIGILNREGCE